MEIISNMSTQIQIILSHYIESLLLNSYRLKTMTKRNIWKCSSILLRPYSQYLDLVAHSKGLKKREPTIDGMRYINNVSKIFSQQKRSYKMVPMSLFPDEATDKQTMNTKYLTIVIALLCSMSCCVLKWDFGTYRKTHNF